MTLFPDDSRQIENSFPMLFHLTPKSIPQKHLELLRNNQQRFMNSHDVYATLKSLAEGKISSSPFITDYSYFHEELPRGRDCDTKICDNCTVEAYEKPWCFNDYSKIQAKIDAYGYFYPNPY